MNLKELLEFNIHTKKDLIRHLKENNLQYKRKNFTITVKDFKLDDFGNVDINYSYNGNTIAFINVSIKKSNTTLENLKDWCYDSFGKPLTDNTNHTTKNPHITWHKRYLYTTYNDDSVYVIGTRLDASNEKSKKACFLGDLNLFSICMVGGLVWGILFFGLFGIGYGYSWLLFALSMIGGVAFGVIMFLALEIIPQFEKASEKKTERINYNKMHVKILEEYENKNFPGSLNALAIYKGKNYISNYTAKIFIHNDSVDIAYIRNRKIRSIHCPYSEISGFWSYMQPSIISIHREDNSWVSLLNIQAHHSEITNYIEDKLGFNSDRFLKIQQVIYDCFVKFDPSSHIALGNDPSTFNESAKYLAKILILTKKSDSKAVKDTIYNICAEEIYESHEELADNIYNNLLQAGLVE